MARRTSPSRRKNATSVKPVPLTGWRSHSQQGLGSQEAGSCDAIVSACGKDLTLGITRSRIGADELWPEKERAVARSPVTAAEEADLRA